jgi:hypothetical protein
MIFPGGDGGAKVQLMKPIRELSDREVHARLVELSGELEWLATQAWSVSGATALRVASRLVNAVSTGFFCGMGSHEPQRPEQD